MDIWSCPLPLLSTRRTLLSGDNNKRSNDRLKELSVTLLNRGNCSTRSLKTPVVTLFGHFQPRPQGVFHAWRAWEGTEAIWTLGQSASARIGCCKVEQRTGWKFTIPTHLIPPHPTQTVLFSNIGFLIAGVSLIPYINPSPPPSSCPCLISSP